MQKIQNTENLHCLVLFIRDKFEVSSINLVQGPTATFQLNPDTGVRIITPVRCAGIV